MPARFTDARIDAVAIDSYRLFWPRICIAAVMTSLIALSGQPSQAAIWLGLILPTEVMFQRITGPARQGALSGADRWRVFVASWVWIGVWTYPGIGLWLAISPVYHELAIGFFGGHLLYVQAHHGRSIASMSPAATPIVAPVIMSLLFPHYSNVEYFAVIIMMLVLSGHALVSAIASISSAGRLLAATHALEIAKLEAEASAEAMAVARAQAVTANEAKTAFLSTMSHEIRTPLNGILGMTQAMATQALPPAQHANLRVIHQSGEALLAILNDLLDLSKIEADRLELEEIAFDLEDLMRSAYATFTASANQKGLSFSLDIEGAHGTYLGDPTRLRQILCNLLSNALKFTETGGIDVRAVYVDGLLSISVADSGIGLSPSAQASLFRSFTQADASITRRFGGTGLGLSISKRLAELMGGDIRVESVEGQGSTFCLNAPLNRTTDAMKAMSETIIDAADDRVFEHLRILAAEDNAVNQLVLKTLLAPMGVELELVGNGEMAVASWATGSWDLILMDMQMPVMDGRSATQEIRRREVSEVRARTPIIALTADVMSHQVHEYLAAGMDNHIAKPIDAAKLYETIELTLAAAEEARSKAA